MKIPGFSDVTQRQMWAVFRRYLIILRKSPIITAVRMVIWPAILWTLAIFLYQSFRDSEVHVSASSMVPFISGFSLLLTSFQVYHFLNLLVSDKSTGFRGLMFSMGLRRDTYHFTNCLSFASYVGLVTITLGIAAKIYILEESKASMLQVIAIFTLLAIQLTGFVFAMASILSSTTLVSILFVLILLGDFFHRLGNLLVLQVDLTLKPLILFLLGALPYETIRILSDSYIVCKNCDETKSSELVSESERVSLSPNLTIASMVFWSVLSFAFGRWFEEVCPWQTETAIKSPFFCLKFTKEKLQDIDMSAMPQSSESSKFFEKSVSHQPVGIQICKVTKIFNKTPVVDNVSFRVHRGETTLLLGHNGAGKTTLMNLILGKLRPESGRVVIQPSDSGEGDEPFIGLCPQTSILDENLTVRQHLDLFTDIKTSKMNSSDREHHIKKTLEDVSLTSHSDKLPSELSGGMKRKLSLAMAFVGKSNVLILDEPSSGLDPDSRVFIWNAIRRYRADRTVLLSTQHIEEADYLGDRIAIMKAGKIICCGSSSFLNKTLGFGYRLRLERKESKRGEVFAFIKNYFDKAVEETDIADSSSIGSGEDRYVSMVVMLKGSKSQDPELDLIKMLKELERDMTGRHIRSFGLRSSTIEDVMLETANMKTESSRQSSTSISFDTNQPLNINPILLKASKSRHSSHLVAQLHFLKALLFKHLHIYKRNIISIAFFRLLLATGGMYWLADTVSNDSYTIASINTFAIFHFIYYPASERVSKFKAIQLSSDANFIIYWLSQLLIDLLSVVFLLVCFDVLLMRSMSGSTKYETPLTEVRLILQAGVAMFALSGLLLAYVASTIVTSARSAIGLFQVPFFTSFILSYLTKLIAALLTKPEIKQAITKINEVIESASIAILPTDSLQYVIYGLHSKCFIRTKDHPCIERVGSSPVALGFGALLAQIICLSLLLFLIEGRLWDLESICRWGNCPCFRRANTPLDGRNEEDEDVAAEAAKASRIIDNPGASWSLVAANLSKSYVRRVRVIEDLWFTVARGECFGLLGVNGAGKSTTFSMIAAECKPDKGRICLQGSYLDGGDVSAYRRSLGFTPQLSLEGLALSPREALRLMARLRQVEEGAVAALVEATLEVLDMTQHGDKPTSKLSGGTQRKLTLGMSLIGNPHLLALDEPTAGVDPMARRRIWRLLRSLRNQNSASIVIASHAMEECEAICDRISIMARGKLRCLGSFLHLRNKFSQRCSVRVQFSGEGESNSGAMPTHLRAIRSLSERLSSIFGSGAIELVDSNISSATYSISDRSFKRSLLFGALREFKQSEGSHVSYLVNDSSLEDIFIELAQEQRELLAQKRPSRH